MLFSNLRDEAVEGDVGIRMHKSDVYSPQAVIIRKLATQKYSRDTDGKECKDIIQVGDLDLLVEWLRQHDEDEDEIEDEIE